MSTRAGALSPSLMTAYAEQDKWICLVIKQKLRHRDESCPCSTSRRSSVSLLIIYELLIVGLQPSGCSHTTRRRAIRGQRSIQLLVTMVASTALIVDVGGPQFYLPLFLHHMPNMPPPPACLPAASPCIFSLTLTLTSKNFATHRSRQTDSPLLRSPSR